MIELDQAQEIVLGDLSTLEVIEERLEDALGCVVAEPLVAKESVPGFANSSMDGFALRSFDTKSGPVELRVTGSVLAGDTAPLHVEAGQAVRIMTGAPMPEGSDCVCMIEDVTVDEERGTVRIPRTIEAGALVRRPGEDVEIGQTLVSPGDVIDPVRLAVLAGQGFGSLQVYRRPRVGVISTGDELATTREALGSGAIRDCNRPLLLALLSESGFAAVDLGIVADDYDEIKRRFERGVGECDAVISTGGVSMGDVDHVKAVIAELGQERSSWMQVAIRPGKPFAFGVVGSKGTPLFGLPGNPVSTRVSFEMFVRPALRLLAGYRHLSRPTVNAVLDCALERSKDGRLHAVHVVARVHDDGLVHIERTARHGSHLLNAIAGANALAMLPDGDGLDVGEKVRTLIVDADQLGAMNTAANLDVV